MTGHKDIKLADHYSKCDEDDQKEFSNRIMKHIRNLQREKSENNEKTLDFENVVSMFSRSETKKEIKKKVRSHGKG